MVCVFSFQRLQSVYDVIANDDVIPARPYKSVFISGNLLHLAKLPDSTLKYLKQVLNRKSNKGRILKILW